MNTLEAIILILRPARRSWNKHTSTGLNTILLGLYLLCFSASSHGQLMKNTSVENVYQSIIYKAADLAKKPYSDREDLIPETLQKIGYQQYRAIRFESDKAIWKGDSRFEIQLFHPGFLYKKPVSINEVVNENIASIPFSSNYFNYDPGAPTINKLNEEKLHFSGFRIHYPLNTQYYKDELIVFQGASYFRPLGPGYLYGASARGLAIDTAEPSGEEFPHFVEFWLVKPNAADNRMVIYALLDSPSISGAYRFELMPGLPTRIDIRADLFPRTTIQKIGLSPLTSMFFYGENKVRHHDDFRPEVHDSDGLLVATDKGEWIWRPLSNPKKLKTSSFSLLNPQGFGLMQRDKDFDHYQDVEANYHKRPSLWVEPKGRPWGKGRVELVEIPTNDETNDNIVAYWIPETIPKPNQQLTLEYTLNILDEPNAALLGKVIQTRIGWAAVPGQDNPPPKNERLFVVDFAGWPDDYMPDQNSIKLSLNTSTGRYRDLQLVKLPDNKTLRVYFKFDPAGNLAADMTLQLTLNDQRISETWSYVWYPEQLAP